MGGSLAFRIEHGELQSETIVLARQFANIILSDLEKYSLERNSPNDVWIDALEYIVSEKHGPRNR
jgi:hypothetical protein